MREFAYARATTVDEASRLGNDADTAFLAGGTTQIDLMKDGVLAPSRLVDITRLPLRGATLEGDTLHVGALSTMEELAAHPALVERAGFVREALLRGASPQLRNMATIGGNLLQRTRCRYFRDPGVAECNKRTPGSGCAALLGVARMHAVLGTSEHCIALHPSDMCVPLVALDAVIRTRTSEGGRELPLGELHTRPGDRPDLEHVLEHGELITELDIPLPAPGARSTYLKVRDRSSYEFALVSVAVATRLEDGALTEARVALGGVGTVPWRASAAERELIGRPPEPAVLAAAARAAIEGAVTVPGTAFKVPLAERAVVRALQMNLEDRA